MVSVNGGFSWIWHSKHSGESWMVCVCVLGVGRVLGGMELTVGSNIMIFFFAYIAASHTAPVVYIYILLYNNNMYFMNIITFNYFVLT